MFSRFKWQRKSVSNTYRAEQSIPDSPRHAEIRIPETQSALLLHAPRQPYELDTHQPLPRIESDHELLVKVSAIGLNPIDWKAP